MTAAGRGKRAGSGKLSVGVAEKLGEYLAASEHVQAGRGGVRQGVLPDTCAWIDYFRGRATDLGRSLERALRDEQVFTCGLVLGELLQGVKAEPDRSAVLRALGSLEYVEMVPRVWMRGGEIAAVLRAKGKRVPHSDLVIASLALEHGLAVLTGDRHFKDVPGLDCFETYPRTSPCPPAPNPLP